MASRAASRRFETPARSSTSLGSLDLGPVAVDRSQLEAVWGDTDTAANLLRVWLHPAASPSTVRAAILTRLDPNAYYVVTARDFLDGVRAVLQLVPALVAIIGVINAQVATVLDRENEIALMRIVGVSERDVSSAMLLECAALGALGGICGAALGAMLGVQFVIVSLRLITGWTIPFRLPPPAILSSEVRRSATQPRLASGEEENPSLGSRPSNFLLTHLLRGPIIPPKRLRSRW